MKSGFALIVVFNILAVVILAMVTIGVGNGAAGQTGFVLRPYFPPDTTDPTRLPPTHPGGRNPVDRVPAQPEESRQFGDSSLAPFRPVENAPPWTELPDGSVRMDR